jgi:hypothetical protein
LVSASVFSALVTFDWALSTEASAWAMAAGEGVLLVVVVVVAAVVLVGVELLVVDAP